MLQTVLVWSLRPVKQVLLCMLSEKLCVEYQNNNVTIKLGLHTKMVPNTHNENHFESKTVSAVFHAHNGSEFLNLVFEECQSVSH